MRIFLSLFCALGFALSSGVGVFLLLGMAIITDYKSLIKPVLLAFGLSTVLAITALILILSAT